MQKIISLFLLFVPLLFTDCQCGNKSDQESRYINNYNNNIDDNLYSDPSSSPNDSVVSRTSGVAPLAVHFFADFVDSVSGDERIDRFHHYDYTWDFGDTGIGNWGTSGKPKNIGKGAVAVHVYEEPGDYNVTLTIRDHSGVVDTENYSISVSDPDTLFSGTNTICINESGDDDFSEAPTGARTIATDDLSTIVQYATAGNRILFKRGSSWTTSGLIWPRDSGPVTIGAYGTEINPDSQGIYENAPQITVTDESFLPLDYKQNWRIMDLYLVDETRSHVGISGATSMQQLLMLRLKIEGFSSGITLSHWNGPECIQNNDIVIALCNVSDGGGNVLYAGSERLALLGNIVADSQTTHIVRVWQAYRSVIAHNIMSGSSLANTAGRGALKLHGPGYYPGGEGAVTLAEPEPSTLFLRIKTEYCIIADNIFGSSGPWPVTIGPQNFSADERLSNIIVERNRFHPDYGSQSATPVQFAMHLWTTYSTVRNNIFDGTGSNPDHSYRVIRLTDRGAMPPQTYIEIYNNTIYRSDSSSYAHYGINVWENVTNSIIRNNLVSFPYATGAVTLIENLSSDLVSSNNLLTDNALFVSPDVADPLARNFSLQNDSPAINAGITVPVYVDFSLNPRPESSSNLGAFEEYEDPEDPIEGKAK